MPKKVKNVYRIVIGNYKAHQVRVEHNKRYLSKTFADSLYGGSQGSFRAAVRLRDKIIKDNEAIPQVREKAFPYYPEARNQSTGIVGVYLVWKKMRSGERHPYYAASISRDRKTSTRAWSVNKYGEYQAFLFAVNYRKEFLKEYYGDKFDEEIFDEQVDNHIDKEFISFK